MSKLFDLLPALYRIRDGSIAQSQQLLSAAEQTQLETLQALTTPLSADEQQQLDQLTAKAARGPLESLLMLVEEQLAVVANDLDQLYDDQFIETCAPWVIPYIGDLIGYQAVNGIAPAVASPRAEVAHTISFRRRKGTVLVMEQLARDVTGWGAHAVEMFQVLGDTQYMDHLRMFNHYAPDVRRWKVGLYMDTGFDRSAHKVDVRRIASGRGRCNIQNIGIFLWSLTAYRVTMTPATPVKGDAQCFRFSTLGRDIALFNNPLSQGTDITAAATPLNVPARLRRRVLCDDLQSGAGAAYYGEGNSLAVYIGGNLLNAYQIRVCNLSGPDGSWINVPGAGSPYAAAVDPELGRIAVPPPPAGKSVEVKTSFYYGFNADAGGGEYSRGTTFTVQDAARVLPFPDTASAIRYTTLQDAFTYAAGKLQQEGQIAIEIAGSGIFTAASLSVDLPAGATLEFRAADGARPTLILSDELAVTGQQSSVFIINGIVIGCSAPPANPSPASIVHAPLSRPDGSPSQLSQLMLTHCTLVPGWALGPQGDPLYGAQANLVAEPSGLQVIGANSIVGGMRVAELATASLSNCIIDATSRTNSAYSVITDGIGAGGALTLIGCTVIGKIHATEFSLISNSIVHAGLAAGDSFEAPLWSDRKQAGCVRFSYLPPGSITPRQFECVEESPQTPEPVFFSLRYGDAGYSKLLASTADTIRRGADDGGEMGAFHFVLAPMRETDLGVRMQEYLPVGLEFGIIYQN
jgi:hypothetical protein